MKRFKKISDYFYFLLGRRDYTAAELRIKAQKYFVEQEGEIEILIKKFVQKDLVSDKRFARSFVRQAMMKGRGLNWVKAQFFAKGLGADIALQTWEKLAAENGAGDVLREVADKKREQLQRRFPNKTDFEIGSKLTQYLLGRGFSYQEIKLVLER